MSKSLLFVYGTLKRDFHNHHILERQKYIGHAQTAEQEWEMYSLGGFPGVVSGEKFVTGELYEVDANVMARCDMLEGHPHFYRRQQITITVGEDEIEGVWMYIYQGGVEGLQKVEGW